MGITTISIYSDTDKNSPFVQFSDESYFIRESPSIDSYLNQDRIIKSCLGNKIDAIHTGYGFLSENAEFAQKVEDAGIVFVGQALKV